MSKKTLRKILSDPHGGIVVFVAVTIATMLIGAGFAIDVSSSIQKRRNLQNIADQAAIAAATYLSKRSLPLTNADRTEAGKVALNYIASSGVTYCNNADKSTCPSGTVHATLNIPPTLSSNDVYKEVPVGGRRGFAEVVLADSSPRFFSSAVGVQGAQQLSVTALAGPRSATASTASILALNSWGQNSNSSQATYTRNGLQFGAAGANALNTNGGKIAVNATSGSHAVNLVGGGSAALRTGLLEVVGGINNVQYVRSGEVVTGALPTADPFANLPLPTPPSSSDPLTQCCPTPADDCNLLTCGQTVAGVRTLYPGIYNGNFTVSANEIIALSPRHPSADPVIQNSWYVQNSVFYVTGFLHVFGSGTLKMEDSLSNAEGVTMMVLGNVAVNSPNPVQLRAPSTGIYKGISIFRQRNDNYVHLHGGTTRVDVKGAIYNKIGEIQLATGANSTPLPNGAYPGFTQLVGGYYDLNGGATRMSVNWSPRYAGNADRVMLLE